ncbi:MAG: Cytosol aminopeptidase [Gemmatimonadaceae bacterium]|nr:Cytosol aminopeptidase [Gemmatimonadaceae bacterium]
MSLKIGVRAVGFAAADSPLLVIILPASITLPPSLRDVDLATGGALERTLARGDFRGARDETLHLTGGTTGPARLLLVGTGTSTDRARALRRAASLAARQAQKMGVGRMGVWAAALSAADVEGMVIGLNLGCWEYSDLKTPPPEEERRAPLEEATLFLRDARRGRNAAAQGTAIAEGYDVARRLAMMPGNVCTPELLAETARSIADRHKLELTVLGRTEMEQEGMGSFLSVAAGTPQEPKLIALACRRGKRGAAPLVLVGKGLCFDTGGISIKPAERMEFMKFDMCGAAGVLGAIEAIARLKLKVNVIGLIGATTNMPSGTAVKPGDVVKASNGKSIEIINTDAEGRLVLADVLHYASRYSPAAVVDAATLTGACVVALGSGATGAMGNQEALVREVIDAAGRASEPAWQLPLWDVYREQIKSDVADIRNTGGRSAGAITAGLFLQEFVSYPWVHLDVAGTAYSETDLVVVPKGPTGVPVGTFVEFVRGRSR